MLLDCSKATKDQLRVYSATTAYLFEQEVHEPHLKVRSQGLGQQPVSMKLTKEEQRHAVESALFE